MEHDGILHVANARDGVALVVMLGVSTRHKHDAHSRTGVELNGLLGKIAFCHAFEQIDEVALDAEHDCFGLWVAHAHIVFNDHWVASLGAGIVAVHADESEEDESLVVDAFCGQTFHCRANYIVLHLLHEFLVGKRNRRHTAHSTCIQARVVLTNALVVLCLRQNLIVLAVGQYKDRAFDATEELLNHDRGTGIAKHTTEHFLQFLLCLVECRQNEHSLTCAEAVSLQHVRRLQRFEKAKSFFECFAREGAIGSRWHVVTLHESLGKFFGTFEDGTLLGRTDDRDRFQLLILLENIVDTLHERVFRTHNNHVDAFLQHKLLDAGKVVGLEVHVFALKGRSCISWSYIELVDFWTLSYFPSQCVLSAATA